MLSPFAWSPLLPRWLAGLILLGLLMVAIFIVAGVDATTSVDVGSWRWPCRSVLG